MSIKIEKGIPMPTRNKTGISATLRAMNIGDSIVIVGKAASARSAAHNLGIKICIRTQNGTVRLWRVA